MISIEWSLVADILLLGGWKIGAGKKRLPIYQVYDIFRLASIDNPLPHCLRSPLVLSAHHICAPLRLYAHDKGKNKVKLFEEQQVRTVLDEQEEKWWFSIVDIIAVLTENDHQLARNYWKVLKNRMMAEGNETVTNCHQLESPAPDGKMRLTDVADTEQVLRLIQSVPSKKAKPFKVWLAKVGSERIDETVYRRLGYSENWINQRIKSIEVRKALTDEWDKSGVKREGEYATLTDIWRQTRY
ncbi:MAG: Bro-N domain-containing protein [Holophagaceae bacterium]|nr:Bro-N domain-containing protein [Holophagaceae bacterium]